MITKIAFYDFDGSLINTPMPDEGKVTWQNVTGQEYPHLGWWGRPESLSTDVFDIKAFPAVADRLRKDNADPNTYTVILTSRLKKLQRYLEIILEKNNLRVDEMSTKDGEEDKDDRIKWFLNRFPDVKEIEIYDDREKEFKIFRHLKQELEGKVNMTVYKVDNGRISNLFEVNDIIRNEVFNYLDRTG